MRNSNAHRDPGCQKTMLHLPLRVADCDHPVAAPPTGLTPSHYALLIGQPASEKKRTANDFQDMTTGGKKPGLQMLKHAGLGA